MPTSTESPKRVAILGADSLVGTHLVPALEASELHAIPVVDYESRSSIRWESRVYDPTSAASVAEALEGCAAAIVADQWVPAGISLQRARFEATRRARAITDGARAAGVVKTVFVSHHATLGDVEERDAASFHLPGSSDNAVVEARWIMEAEIFRAIKEGLEIPVVIPGLVVGPRDDRGDASLLLEILRGRWPALPNGRVELVDARDLARSIVQAITVGRSGRRYPVSAANLDVSGFLDAIVRIRKIDRPRVVRRELPSFAARVIEVGFAAAGRRIEVEAALAHIRPGRINDSKARGELHFVARPIGKTLEDAIRWYEDAFGWTA